MKNFKFFRIVFKRDDKAVPNSLPFFACKFDKIRRDRCMHDILFIEKIMRETGKERTCMARDKHSNHAKKVILALSLTSQKGKCGAERMYEAIRTDGLTKHLRIGKKKTRFHKKLAMVTS